VSLTFVDGRRIYLRARDNQSIRICTENNLRGQWAHEFWLDAGRHVTEQEVEGRASVTDLVEWLASRGARTQLRPTIVGRGAGETRSSEALVRVEPDSNWMASAVPAVEAAINELIKEFVEEPFLHRVEHSLHIRLYELIAQHPSFQGRFQIGKSQHSTQLVHKEWPETVPRKDKNGRGNFDLAILSRNQLATAELWQFDGGHIEAAIVIEVGLNYDYKHLYGDHEKLLSSSVKAGYLVDLRRRGQPDTASERLVCDPTPPIRAAYAHCTPPGAPTVRYLNDR
jgi:hypothetical protein